MGGSRADVFAFFGDRKAEREAEKLEIEEWQLVEDIETLEKKPTTRQLLGWLSPRFDMPVRLGACCSSRGASSQRSCASSAGCFFHFSAVAARTRTHHSPSKRRLELYSLAVLLRKWEVFNSSCRAVRGAPAL